MGNTIENAPELEIDKRYPPNANGVLERRIAWNLCKHLEKAGFIPRAEISEGDEPTPTVLEAMEMIFNLDEARIAFRGDNGAGRVDRVVLLVLGNGVDIVSDWNYSTDDKDGFNAAMEAFNAEVYA